MDASPCVPCCSTPQTVNVPGSTGASAVTVTKSSFVIPALDGVTTVSINVVDSSWITNGQNLYIGGANFIVTGISDSTHITVLALGFTNDTVPGSTVAAGAIVEPGVGNFKNPGIATPVSIANGGTGSTSKAAAQLALGLGQNNAFYYADGLAQAFTNAYASVGGALTISQNGNVFVLAVVTVDFIGTTFAAQRTMSFKLRDITAGVDLANTTINRKTGIYTTLTQNSQDFVIAGLFTSIATHQIQVL